MLRSCPGAVLAGAGQGVVRRRLQTTDAEAPEPAAPALEPGSSTGIWGFGAPGSCGRPPSLRGARGAFLTGRSWFRGQGGVGT